MEQEKTVDYQIKTTWLSLSRMYNQMASDYGMSLPMGYVLINITSSGTPATSIGPLLGMEPTSLSRLLKTMEDTQLITRKKDKDDKRIVRIYLTDEGVLKRKVAQLMITRFNTKLGNKIPQQDLEVFFRVIQTINNFANEYIPPKHKQAHEINL